MYLLYTAEVTSIKRIMILNVVSTFTNIKNVVIVDGFEGNPEFCYLGGKCEDPGDKTNQGGEEVVLACSKVSLFI